MRLVDLRAGVAGYKKCFAATFQSWETRKQIRKQTPPNTFWKVPKKRLI